jgi:hypothetical protein
VDFGQSGCNTKHPGTVHSESKILLENIFIFMDLTYKLSQKNDDHESATCDDRKYWSINEYDVSNQAQKVKHL